MQAKNLKSTSTLSGNNLVFSISDGAASSEVSVDLSAILGSAEAALKAIFFSAKTRLRNATGGKSLDEASAIIADLAASMNAGEWSARQREAGETRHSPLIRALALVLHGGDSSDLLAKAQAEYDADIAARAQAAGVDLESDDDDSKKAASKLKREYRKQLEATPAIKAAVLKLEAEAAAEKARKMAEAAEAAAAAAAQA